MSLLFRDDERCATGYSVWGRGQESAKRALEIAAAGGRNMLMVEPIHPYPVRRVKARVKTKGPRLVLVSSGTVEANRASGLRSPVLLDQSFAAGRALGVTGTPSAVLVDAEGKIASGIAVGAPSVLELAEARA